jgi:tetratricopeptide (TPR) repeat protein
MPNIALRAYLDEVGRLADQEALEEVIGHCKYILTKFPKNLAVYRLYGRALLGKSRYDEARDIFERILSAAPNDFAAHVSMSEIFQEQGQEGLPRAIFHLERAFEQDPNNPALHEELRRLYELRDGEAPESIQLTQEALARLYFKGQLYDQATAEINAALRTHKDRPDLLILLMQTQWANFRPLEAADTALRVLQNFPYSLDANRILAQIWLQNGRPSDARPFVERLGELNPFAALELVQPGDESAANQIQIQRLDWNARSSAAMLTNAPDWVQNMGDFMGGQQLGSAADMAAAIGDDPFGLNTQRPVSGEWMLNFTAPADVPVPKTDWFTTDSVFGQAAAASTDDLPDWFTTIEAPPAEPPKPAIPSWLDEVDELADAPAPPPSSAPAFAARSQFGAESFPDPLGTDAWPAADLPVSAPATAHPEDDWLNAPLPPLTMTPPSDSLTDDWAQAQPAGALGSSDADLMPSWDDLNALTSPPAESATLPVHPGSSPVVEDAPEGFDLWASFDEAAVAQAAVPASSVPEHPVQTSPPGAATPVDGGTQPDATQSALDSQETAEPLAPASMPDWLRDAVEPGSPLQGDTMTTDNIESSFDFDDLDPGSGAPGSGLPEWLKQDLAGNEKRPSTPPAEPASTLPDWLTGAMPDSTRPMSSDSTNNQDLNAASAADFMDFGDFALPEFDDLTQGTSSPANAEAAPAESPLANEDDWFSKLDFGRADAAMVEPTGAPPGTAADPWAEASIPAMETADDDWISGEFDPSGASGQIMADGPSSESTADAGVQNLPTADDDWLSALGSAPELPVAETTSAPEPISAASDDDWLSALGSAPELPAAETTSEPEPISAASDDDWLSALGSAPELPVAETTSAPEPISAAGDDDWLSALGSAPELPAPETTSEPEPISAASDDDWLSALGSAPELPVAETASEPEPISAAADDDWLSALGSAPELPVAETTSEPEPISAASDDDWLSALGSAPELPVAEAETTLMPTPSDSTPDLLDWMADLPADEIPVPAPDSAAKEPADSDADDWLSDLRFGAEPEDAATWDDQSAAEPMTTDQLLDWMGTPAMDSLSEAAIAPSASAESSLAGQTDDEDLMSLFDPEANEPQKEQSWLDSLANNASAPRSPLTLQDAIIDHPEEKVGASTSSEQNWLAGAPERKQDGEDWLATLGTSIQSPDANEPEPLPVDQESPAWLADLSKPAEPEDVPAEPPKKGISGLLGQLPPKQPDAERRLTGVLDANTVPDWMQAFNDDATPSLESVDALFGDGGTGEPASAGTGAEAAAAQGEGMVEPVDTSTPSTIPDWLADMEPITSQPDPAAAQAGEAQPTPADDSDWLTGMRPLADGVALEDIGEPEFDDLLPLGVQSTPDRQTPSATMGRDLPASPGDAGSDLDFGDIDIDALLSAAGTPGDQLANNADLIENTPETKTNPPNRFEFDRLPAWLRKRTGR